MNVLFNVIALGDFHDLTTFDSMRRQCMSTKTFLAILSPRLERGSKDRSVPTALDLQLAVREHQRWVVKEATAAVTVEIYPLPASRQVLQPPQALVEKMSFVDQRH